MNPTKIAKAIGAVLIAALGVPELKELVPQIAFVTPEMIGNVVNGALALWLLTHDFHNNKSTDKNTLGLLK